MPSVILRRPPGYTKPPSGAQIEFDHPLAQGIKLCVLGLEGGGSAAQDLVAGNTVLSTAALPMYVPCGTGFGWNFNISGGMVFAEDFPEYKGILNAITMEVMVHILGGGLGQQGGGFGQLLGKDDGTNRAWAIDYGDSGGGTGPGVRLLVNGGLAVQEGSTDGLEHYRHVIATYDRITAKIYTGLDGKMPRITASAASTTAFNEVTAKVGIGVRDGGGVALRGHIRWARVWNRALSEDEVERLYAEPFSMLRGPEVLRRYWFTLPLSIAPLIAAASSQQVIVRHRSRGF